MNYANLVLIDFPSFLNSTILLSLIAPLNRILYCSSLISLPLCTDRMISLASSNDTRSLSALTSLNLSMRYFRFLTIASWMILASLLTSNSARWIGIFLSENFLSPSWTAMKVWFHSLKSISPSFLMSISSNKSLIIANGGTSCFDSDESSLIRSLKFANDSLPIFDCQITRTHLVAFSCATSFVL